MNESSGAQVLLLATLGVASSNPVLPSPRAECPVSYGNILPTLIISLDGFRADYLDRGLTPTIDALSKAGVMAPYMKASFPTVTFPNHYSIVTGKLSATYFWPGSDADIGGQHPTHGFPFNDSTPFEDRVDQVLDWIVLPEETRPSWISLYFNEPDHTGHEAGPDSTEVDTQLVYVDLMVTRLMDGLEMAGLTPCVNIIVVVDHGMALSGANYVIKLADYIPDLYDTAYTYT
ncbi:hypothetical protein SK128_014599 [Halocaridina rubra]|uniref:Uncharacterized protein n=1 Tax=Halocaridina rubra TaxID=373956 RepID=A0AAN9AD78_HALRR